MKVTTYWPLLAFFLFIAELSAQQDPYFSQFFANRVYLNPAYAGFDPGVNLTVNYRDQWFGVRGGESGFYRGGFKTYNATLNAQIPCLLDSKLANFGVALSALHDRAGSAPLITNGYIGALSFERNGFEDMIKRWKSLKRLDLRVGFQAGVYNRKLESDHLIYSYQLHPIDGIRPGSGSMIDINSDNYANLAFGILVRAGFWKKRTSRNLFSIGYTMSNVLQPDVSLRGEAIEAPLYRRHTFYVGGTFRFNSWIGVQKPFYIAPQWRWDRQRNGDFNTQTFGAYVYAELIYVGAFFQYNFPSEPVNDSGVRTARNNNILSINAGVDVSQLTGKEEGLQVGLSYDLHLTGLDQGDTAGVIEFNMRVRLFRGDSKLNCGGLGRFEIYNGDCPVRF